MDAESHHTTDNGPNEYLAHTIHLTAPFVFRIMPAPISRTSMPDASCPALQFMCCVSRVNQIRDSIDKVSDTPTRKKVGKLIKVEIDASLSLQNNPHTCATNRVDAETTQPLLQIY
jgi:hypothetical protein